jgi:hypothetical protein
MPLSDRGDRPLSRDGIARIPAAYSVMMTPVRDTQLVIDRTTLYWGLLTLLVLAILFSSYLVGYGSDRLVGSRHGGLVR